MEMIEFLTLLILGHYIGDYALQSEWVATNKRNDVYVLFAHSAIYTFVITAICSAFGYFSLYLTLFIMIGHFLMDNWKNNYTQCPWALPIDQAIHMGQLFIVWIIYTC